MRRLPLRSWRISFRYDFVQAVQNLVFVQAAKVQQEIKDEEMAVRIIERAQQIEVQKQVGTSR